MPARVRTPSIKRLVGTLNNAGIPNISQQHPSDAPTAAVAQLASTRKGPLSAVGSPSSIKAGDSFKNPYLDTLRNNVKSSQGTITSGMSALNSLSAAGRRLMGNVPGADASHIGSAGANSINVGSLPNVPGTAGAIINYGKQFLGDPYVFGAAGPTKFDCSGLTQYIYKHFGINLPHKASLQAKVGQGVDMAHAQPGDLIIMNTSHGIAGHVGIYLGNGMMLHAPHTGDVVKVSNVKGYNINTVRRLIGG